MKNNNEYYTKVNGGTKVLYFTFFLLMLFGILFLSFSCKQRNTESNASNTSKEKELVPPKDEDEHKAKYKVEHWQENAENDDFTKFEVEELEGVIGKKTDAKAKTYESFDVLQFEQLQIKSDASTVIKIQYKRKLVSLILDLNGGSTNTQLSNGNDGKKILKGKIGSKVKVEAPNKTSYEFQQWRPTLPKNFPSKDSSQVYVADWKKLLINVNIKGDERLIISEPTVINVKTSEKGTWKELKDDIIKKASLKSGWDNGDYGIYDFKIGDEKGEELLDSAKLTDDLTIYIRSNYTKFKWDDNTKLTGYTGEKPRGKIIIPTKITKLEGGSFNECEDLEAVDFSGCNKLSNIGNFVTGSPFVKCKKLKDVNFAGCKKLFSIFLRDSGIERIDLSPCEKLKDIYLDGTEIKDINLAPCKNLEGLFLGKTPIAHVDLSTCTKLLELYLNETSITSVDVSSCKELSAINLSKTTIKNIDLSNCTELITIRFIDCKDLELIDIQNCKRITNINALNSFFGCISAQVKLPTSIATISYKNAFGWDVATYCKQVLVPNEIIKNLVKATGYPENRIEVYH